MNKYKIASLLLILCVLISCNFQSDDVIDNSNTQKDIKSIAPKRESTKNSDGFTLPLGWPWRGCVIQNHYLLDVDKDLELLKSKGVDFVVIYIKTRKIAEFENISARKAFKWSLDRTDKLLDKCKELDMRAMIYFSEMPMNPTLKITQNDIEFWDNEELIEEALSNVETVVERFSKRGDELQAYQFFGEPGVRRSETIKTPRVKNWNKVFASIYKIIREKDKERFIVYAPGPWGGPWGYKNLKDINKDPKIIYSVHTYFPNSFSHMGITNYKKVDHRYPGFIDGKEWNIGRMRETMKPVIDFSKNNKRLILIGEYSSTYISKGWDRYLEDLTIIFDENNFSHTYFAYNGFKQFAINKSNASSNSKKDFGKFKYSDRKKRLDFLETLWKR